MKMDWRHAVGALFVVLLVGGAIWHVVTMPDPSKPTAQVPAGSTPMTITPPEQETRAETSLPAGMAH